MQTDVINESEFIADEDNPEMEAWNPKFNRAYHAGLYSTNRRVSFPAAASQTK